MCQQLRCEAINLQQLSDVDETAEPLAIAYYAACVCRTYAVQQLQCRCVGIIELNDKGLPPYCRRLVVIHRAVRPEVVPVSMCGYVSVAAVLVSLVACLVFLRCQYFNVFGADGIVLSGGIFSVRRKNADSYDDNQ